MNRGSASRTTSQDKKLKLNIDVNSLAVNLKYGQANIYSSIYLSLNQKLKTFWLEKRPTGVIIRAKLSSHG